LQTFKTRKQYNLANRTEFHQFGGASHQRETGQEKHNKQERNLSRQSAWAKPPELCYNFNWEKTRNKSVL